MFRTRLLALAAASALSVSGCATSSWQRPPDHPADPGAASGVTAPITSLDRYRTGSGQAGKPLSNAAEKDNAATDDMDHTGGHQHEESQP